MEKQKSILIVVTNHSDLPNGHATGLWLEEYATPASLFRQQNIAITVVSLHGGKVPVDPRSLANNESDPDQQAALKELSSTKKLSDIDLSAFDALFFPGGHGVMFDLAQSPNVGKAIMEFVQSDRVVAAVCHGPAALVSAYYPDGRPLVSGRKVAAFTNEEEIAAELDQQMPFLLQSKLEELGARYQNSAAWSDHVVVDGKLITGQNPQSSASIAKALLHAI